MPAWEEFIYRNYCWSDQWLDAYPVYTMNTSRGCPFECTFCSVKSIWGQTYRSMSPERVVDDILFMKKFYGAKGIFFREDHFTLNKNRTVDFCELMIKKNVNIDWICETRADQLNDYAYQKLMADAGCKAFYIGVESGSPQMLKMFKKGETVEQFIEAFDVSKKVGIKTYASFVVGVPYETDEDRLLTDKFIERIKPDFIGKNVFVGIPGSSLVDQIKKDNLYEYEDENHILYPVNFLRNVYKYYGDNDYFKVYEKHKNEVKKIIFDSEIVFTNDLSLSRLSAAKIDENIIEMEFQFIVNGKIPKDYTIYFHGSVEDSDVRYLPDDRKIYGFENWDFRPKQPMSEWKYGAFSVSKNIFITVSSYFLRMGLFDSEKNETVGDSAILGFVDLSNI